MHIATLGFYIILMVFGVFGVLSYRAALAGKKMNDVAHSAMIIAKSNANTIAALHYCVKHEVSSDSVH